MRDELKELLDSIDVESYLDREGLTYRLTRGSSGQQLNLKYCPVCGGSEFKVYLNADSGLGNCFHGSCDSRFNKFSFIRANLGAVSVAETIRHIKTVASEHGWRQKRTVKYVVDEDLGELKFPDSIELPFGGKNLKYLTDRGITPEIASYFYLRYSKSGVFKYRDGDRERYQDYSARVIIPIYDFEGALVSFQGRDMTGAAERKFLFPPGYASTGKYLYNGYNAMRSKRVVLCEGFFDVASAKMALDEDVSLRDVTPIGSFGKHLSNGGSDDQVGEFLKLKKVGLREVCIAWDGEKSAMTAAVKTALVLNSCGLKVSVAFLPKGCDPNEIPRHTFRAAYSGAMIVNRSTVVKVLAKINEIY